MSHFDLGVILTFNDPKYLKMTPKMTYFGNNIAFKIDCAACGSKTFLKTDVYGLPMDPLVALYSAVPSQVPFLCDIIQCLFI